MTAEELAAAVHLAPWGAQVEPLHRQIEAALRSLLLSGRVQPGDLLPGELDLAARLGVSRHTMRHALGVLVTEGWLNRHRGIGTRVANPAPRPPIERGLESFYAFAWEAQARGAEHRSAVLERRRVAADVLLAEALGVPRGSALERIHRLRSADGEPLVLETAYLPAELAAGLLSEVLEREAIYDALERLHGLRVTRARETIRPVVLEQAAAALLGVRAGDAAFEVDRTTWAGDRAVEWQRSLVRGDRYLYAVELPRRGGPV